MLYISRKCPDVLTVIKWRCLIAVALARPRPSPENEFVLSLGLAYSSMTQLTSGKVSIVRTRPSEAATSHNIELVFATVSHSVLSWNFPLVLWNPPLVASSISNYVAVDLYEVVF